MSYTKRATLLFCIVLSGCVTQYTYTPPTSPQGQACVAKCSSTQQVCKAREDDRVAYELPQCEREAEIEYIACLKYSKTEKDEESCHKESCYISPNYYMCESEFRECFQLCGGTIGILK